MNRLISQRDLKDEKNKEEKIKKKKMEQLVNKIKNKK